MRVLSGVAKIADFGSIARLPETADHTSASAHSILYVPPEAMDGRYTFASDIYQVGMILYEMVNGPMDYSYAHYVLPKHQSRLARDGTCYESLDPFEQARLNRECIKTLCKAQKLLSHGRRQLLTSPVASVVSLGRRLIPISRRGTIRL